MTKTIKKRPVSRWARWLLIAIGGVLLLVCVVLIIASTNFFGRKIILPIAAKQTGLTLKADTFRISPGLIPPGRVRITNLTATLEPDGTDQILAIPQGNVSFSLYALLGGRLVIKNGVIDGLNLDLSDDKLARLQALMDEKQSPKDKPPKPKSPDKPSSEPTPPHVPDGKTLPLDKWLALIINSPLRVNSMELKNARIRYAMSGGGGAAATSLELPLLDATVKRLGYPGETAAIDVTAANISADDPDQNSRFQIESARVRVLIDQPASRAASPQVVIKSDDARLTRIAGMLHGNPIAPIDLLTPFEATLSTDSWRLSNFRIQARQTGRLEMLMNLQAKATLQPEKMTAELSLTQLDGDLINAIFGQGGAYTFSEQGISVKAVAGVNLRSRNMEWTIDKSVNEFIVRSSARPDLQFAPADIEFHHSGQWDAASRAVTLQTMNMLLREGDRVVAEGRLDNPMTMALGGFQDGAMPFVDSNLSIRITDLKLAQFSPLMTPFLDAEMDGTLSADLNVKTEESTKQAAASGRWQWSGASFSAPWFALAGDGRRNYTGEFDVASGVGAETMTLAVNRFSAAIEEGGRSLASITASGKIAPGETSTINFTAEIPQSASGEPVVLGRAAGRDIAIASLRADARGTFDHKSQVSNLSAQGAAAAPIAAWLGSSSPEAPAASVSSAWNLDVRQQGNEWTLKVANTHVEIQDGAQPLMKADLNSDLRLIADFNQQPSLTGTAAIRIDRLNDRIMDLLANAEIPKDQTGPNVPHAASPRSSAQGQTSQLASTVNPVNRQVASSAKVAEWPIFNWKTFDLTIHSSIDDVNVSGYSAEKLSAVGTIKNHPAKSSTTQSAFSMDTHVSAESVQGEAIKLTRFVAKSTGDAIYTHNGQVRIENANVDMSHSGMPLARAAVTAQFDIPRQSGTIDVTNAVVHPAVWTLMPQTETPPSMKDAMINATASAQIDKWGEAGSLTFQSNVSGIQLATAPALDSTAFPLSEATVVSNGKTAWENWGEIAVVENFRGHIDAAEKRLAEATLSKPFRVERRSDDRTQWTWGDIDFTTAFTQFDLSQWKDVVEPFGFGAGQGIVDGNAAIQSTGAFQSITAKGRMSLKDLAWAAPEWSIAAQAPLSGAMEFDLAIANMTDVAINKIQGRLSDQSNNFLTLTSSGRWHLEHGGAIDATISSRSAAASTPWMPVQFAGMAPGWQAMDITIKSARPDQIAGPATGRMEWTIAGLKHGMTDSMMEQVAESLDLTGALDFSWSATEAVLNLQKSDIQAYPKTSPGNNASTPGRLSATGQMTLALPVGNTPRVTGAFDVKGSDITAQFFEPSSGPQSLDDLMKAEQKREAEKARANSLDEADPVPSPLSAYDLTHVDLTWRGEFTNMSVTPLRFSAVTFDGGMKQGVAATAFTASADPVGSITGNALADFSQALPAYQMQTKVDDIPADKLATAFLPFLHNRMQGRFFCDVNLATAGWDQAQMMSALDGKIQFKATDGQLRNVKLLDELVGITGLSELNILKFFTAEGDMDINKGRMTVHFMNYRGEFQKLGVDGQIDLRNPDAMPIDLKMRLALGAPLISKIGQRATFTRLTDAEGYLRIPSLIGMSGTLQSPKPSIAGGDLLRQFKDGGLDMLRSLIEREARLAPPEPATAPTPTPAPEASPTESPSPAGPTPSPEVTPSPTPDDRSDKEKLRDDAIGIGIGILDGYLKRKEQEKK